MCRVARFLHSVGVYFGLAEPDEAEQREWEADLLSEPRSRIVRRAVVYGVFMCVGWALLQAALRGFDGSVGKWVVGGILFGALMGTVYGFSNLRMRSQAEDRARREPPPPN